jgi:hypothetical protein
VQYALLPQAGECLFIKHRKPGFPGLCLGLIAPFICRKGRLVWKEMTMNVSMKNFHAFSQNTLAPGQVASLIAEARLAAGYSVEDLSVTTGLVNAEIVSIENGTELDPAKLKRVAAALKVPVTAFRPS